MSRRSRSRLDAADDADGSGIDLTPLIDMVFILLIFFMVTASFIRDSALPIERPSAHTATPPDQLATVVTVSADEQIWLGSDPVDIRQLRQRLEQPGTRTAAGTALILADRNSRTGLLVQVMDQLRLAGFTDISVAASQPTATDD